VRLGVSAIAFRAAASGSHCGLGRCGCIVGAMQPPETRYALRPDGVSIAYQVLGEGPLDLVFCFGWISHLDYQWTSPDITRFFTRLASFSRLVLYDKAGTGLSDPIPHLATLEERVEDIRTVMDAVGVERAALFGESEAGPSALLSPRPIQSALRRSLSTVRSQRRS
jgi:hypothetical protein